MIAVDPVRDDSGKMLIRLINPYVINYPAVFANFSLLVIFSLLQQYDMRERALCT